MDTVALRAQVVVASKMLVRCIVEGRPIDLHPIHLLPGTTVQRSGDQGLVVIPAWLAETLSIAPSARVKV
jgi:hypothetical protein